MGVTDVFSIQNQYASIPFAGVVIILVAAVHEPESMGLVLNASGACLVAIAARMVVPAWLYDYLALIGLLQPLLFGVGLTYYGLGLPSIQDLISICLMIAPVLLLGCILIPIFKVPFMDNISMDGHLLTLPLAFAIMVVGATLTEPADLDSLKVVMSVTAASALSAAVLPR